MNKLANSVCGEESQGMKKKNSFVLMDKGKVKITGN